VDVMHAAGRTVFSVACPMSRRVFDAAERQSRTARPALPHGPTALPAVLKATQQSSQRRGGLCATQVSFTCKVTHSLLIEQGMGVDNSLKFMKLVSDVVLFQMRVSSHTHTHKPHSVSHANCVDLK